MLGLVCNLNASGVPLTARDQVPRPSTFVAKCGSNRYRAFYEHYLAAGNPHTVSPTFYDWARRHLHLLQGKAEASKNKGRHQATDALGLKFPFELLDNFIGAFLAMFYPHSREEEIVWLPRDDQKHGFTKGVPELAKFVVVVFYKLQLSVLKSSQVVLSDVGGARYIARCDEDERCRWLALICSWKSLSLCA